MVIHNPILTGSFTVNNIDVSSITSSAANITALNATTASLNSFSASVLTFTSSAATRLGALEAATASLYTATSSFSGRVGALEAATSSLYSYTSSLNLKTASFATTGSNNFTAVQHISDTTNPTGFDSTGSLYSEGGLHLKKDAYISSSLYIKGNLTVYGTQSVSYITSSQLNISTNIITVNTSTPSIRFGGLAVQDSGSAGGLTGSLLWDSQNNSWLYNNPSGSGNYDSSLVIMGPRNSSTLGNEVGLSCNYLVQGHGHHHTTSSAIYHDSACTNFYSNALFVSGSGNVGIGTTNPTKRLHISGSGVNSGITFDVDNASIVIRGSSTSNFDLNNEGGGCLRLYGSEVQFRTSTIDPAVTIKNSGVTCFACTICAPTVFIGSCLLINQTSSLLDVASARVEMSGIGSTFPTSQASYNVFANHGVNPTWVGYLNFNKSRGTTQGSVTTVADGDKLGMIRFSGADGSEQIRATEIYSEVDGAVSKCCVPGRIIFATTGNNLNGPIERFRISSTGVATFSNSVQSTDFRYTNTGYLTYDTANTGTECLVIRKNGTSVLTFNSNSSATFANTVCTNAGLVTNTLSFSCNTGDDRSIYMSLNCSYNYNSGAANTIARSVNSLKFLWYNNCWEIGATRGDDTAIQALVFARQGNTYLAMTCHGIANFSCQVCASAGVKFGSGNCILNNYDEGKWCIYACGSTSGAGPVGEGSYTRVGRLVTASFLINSQTFPSYTGVLRLSLPFTAGSGSGLGGNMTWQAGGVYFYPFSAWCSGTNFTGLDATVFNSANYVVFAIGNVNGDRQGSVSSTTTATSGAGGLYLRFTVTYET